MRRRSGSGNNQYTYEGRSDTLQGFMRSFFEANRSATAAMVRAAFVDMWPHVNPSSIRGTLNWAVKQGLVELPDVKGGFYRSLIYDEATWKELDEAGLV
jgi:hypothetical protein